MVLFVSSYYREILFRSLNALIAGKTNFYSKTIALPVLEDWSIDALNQLKYLLTILFSLWFILISLFGIKYSFSNRIALHALYIYYSILGVILIFFVVLIAPLNFSTMYPWIRKIVGLIHTPIPFILVSIGYYSYKKL